MRKDIKKSRQFDLEGLVKGKERKGKERERERLRGLTGLNSEGGYPILNPGRAECTHARTANCFFEISMISAAKFS